MTYSVLIPAYNAGRTLNRLLDQLAGIHPAAQEIVVVNDGSADHTAQICTERGVTLINLEQNCGKGYALRRGFEYYRTKENTGFIVCLDADLQHPPELIPDFITYASETDCRFVIGNRSKKIGEMPFHRILSNRITSFIISMITGQKIYDSQCGFRLIDINTIKNLDLTEDGFQQESEMILKAAQQGVDINFIPIPAIYNDTGSHIGNVRDTFKFVLMVLKFIFNRDKKA